MNSMLATLGNAGFILKDAEGYRVTDPLLAEAFLRK